MARLGVPACQQVGGPCVLGGLQGPAGQEERLGVAPAFGGVEFTEATECVRDGPGVPRGLGALAGLGEILVGTQQRRAPLVGRLACEFHFAARQVDAQFGGFGGGDRVLVRGFAQGGMGAFERGLGRGGVGHLKRRAGGVGFGLGEGPGVARLPGQAGAALVGLECGLWMTRQGALAAQVVEQRGGQAPGGVGGRGVFGRRLHQGQGLGKRSLGI